MSKLEQGFVNFANEWDKAIYKYIPFYDEMVTNLIANIPFNNNENFSLH